MDTTTSFHLCIYIVTGITSYTYSLLQKSIISPILLGWSIYGMTSVGHDLLHIPTIKNRYLAFFCMDTLIINSDYWIQSHNKLHHCDLDGPNDIMKLKGENIFQEWYNLLEICKETRLKDHLYRIPFYYAMYHLRWFQVIEMYITVFFCLAYFTYITHSHSIETSYKKNTIEHNLSHTLDIFPESRFVNLLFGGINCHATHHCYPQCNRSQMYSKSRYLSKHYPKHYRSINTIKELYLLYKNR